MADATTDRAEGFRPPRDRHDERAFAAMAGEAFDLPTDDAGAWLERAGAEHARLLFEGDLAVAGLLRIPMGQWFGGRSVPMTGVAAVAVPAEHRGRGAARRLMAAALTEMRGEETALSALYPATTTLYRRGGYEIAGGRYEVEIPAASLRGLPESRETSLRALQQEDEEALFALAREEAAAGSGQLDRGPYIWRRIREPVVGTSRGYVVEADGRLEGYAFLKSKGVQRLGRHDYDMEVPDISARTPRAASRLLALLAEHAGVGRRVVLTVAPAHPLLLLLPERHECVRLLDPWMLRIVHVPAALAARGYAAGARGTLVLEVEDDVLAENTGRHRLDVAGGEGRVSPASAADGPTLRLHVRGLASLYSGHMTPDALAVAGLADGPPEARALAAALFAGPAPTMSDMF
ncbi:MAG: GNAT family N-acetyltransferase [Planctomycetota bacterium]|jgi:predicted acetyltransferase